MRVLAALLSLPFAVLPAPYQDPAFGSACEFPSFGEWERPPWHVIMRDPLCVEYAKQDITFDNGGAKRCCWRCCARRRSTALRTSTPRRRFGAAIPG